MVRGIQWNSFQWIQWSTRGFSGICGDSVEYGGIQWITKDNNEVHENSGEYLGIQWSNLGYSGVPGDTVE